MYNNSMKEVPSEFVIFLSKQKKAFHIDYSFKDCSKVSEYVQEMPQSHNADKNSKSV